MVRGNLKGLKSGGNTPVLSSTEKEILSLLTDEYLTPKQVSIRRKTTVQAVHKTIRSLKKKGVLGKNNTKVVKNGCTIQPKQPIRLHGQQFRIGILFKDERYKRALSKCNLLYLDGQTVRLHRDSVLVYSNVSFFGESVQVAMRKSVEYWERLFHRLEHDLRVILVKPRSQNIKIVSQHFAEIRNELAEECERKAEKIRVFAKDDGKLWFVIDNSFNLREAETVHPVTSEDDMENVVQPFFNDLREFHPPTLSQVWTVVNKVVELQRETASGLQSIVKLMQGGSPVPDPVDSKLDYFG